MRKGAHCAPFSIIIISMYITKKIRNITKKKPALFTTTSSLADFSEFQGLDNLQSPDGPISKSLKWATNIYGTKSTFYLINGSSSGIVALMLAIAKRDEKVLIARNAHKSLVNALFLSGADPVWLQTEWNREWNISGPACPAKIAQKLEDNPDIKAVFITSPTYEGVASDIEAISAICRKKNIPLIVDEAHGALWPFSGQLPDSAIHCGADACVQSLHKNAHCLNPGALLHLSKASKIKPGKVQQALNIINTTSPSYVLLSNIENAIEHLNSAAGRKELDRLIKNINAMKNRLENNAGAVFLENNDPTKIFFGVHGLSGQVLSDYLEDKFNIEVELNNEKGLLSLTGIGTSEKNMKKLEKAIIKAFNTLPGAEVEIKTSRHIRPVKKLTPSQAFLQKSKFVNPSKSIGQVSKEVVVEYPPGIPLIIPGEVIQEAHIKFLKDRNKIEIVL